MGHGSHTTLGSGLVQIDNDLAAALRGLTGGVL